MLGIVVLLFVLALLTLPAWPYSRNWGYSLSGGLSLVACVVLMLLLFRF